MSDAIRRARFYQGQFLGADDLAAEQVYHRDMRRRHNIGHHTWGVVVGLALDIEDATRLWIGPGMAVDGFGREIFVLAAAELGPEAFLAEGLTSGMQPVWLAYHEEATVPARYGYAECADGTLQRVVENYRLLVGEPEDPDGRDAVVVAGEAGDTGASIPYQELPADDVKARWYVLLGEVFWDGVNRVFLSSDEGKRPWSGVVAQTVWAPAGDLRLTDRRAAGDLQATVEGKLDVEDLHRARGDIQLHGTDLVALNADGGGDPVSLGRNDPGGKGGADLRLEIGENPDPAKSNRFAVQAGGNDRLTVADDGTTDIRGDTTIRDEKELRLDGGRLGITRKGTNPPNWIVRQPDPGDGHQLQFRETINEPTGDERVVFELLDTAGNLPDAVLRLHGASGATLSAQQLIDLTHGQITQLHAHPFASTTFAGRVQIATSSQTAVNGSTGARLVVGASDGRLLTVAEKNQLTGGGVTALHQHQTSTVGTSQRVLLQADEGLTDLQEIDLGTTRRVRAFAMLTGTERGGGFIGLFGTYGDAYVEVFQIDGNARPSIETGYRNFGPSNSANNLRSPTFAGLARRIRFRLRAYNGHAWALGLVFHEAP